MYFCFRFCDEFCIRGAHSESGHSQFCGFRSLGELLFLLLFLFLYFILFFYFFFPFPPPLAYKCGMWIFFFFFKKKGCAYSPERSVCFLPGLPRTRLEGLSE